MRRNTRSPCFSVTVLNARPAERLARHRACARPSPWSWARCPRPAADRRATAGNRRRRRAAAGRRGIPWTSRRCTGVSLPASVPVAEGLAEHLLGDRLAFEDQLRAVRRRPCEAASSSCSRHCSASAWYGAGMSIQVYFMCVGSFGSCCQNFMRIRSMTPSNSLDLAGRDGADGRHDAAASPSSARCSRRSRRPCGRAC